MKKIKIYSEAAYLPAIIIMAISVSMTAAADFGVSMIVAPAYILSLKVPFLTFGQSEYVIQALLFIAFCVAMKRFKFIYLTSFMTGIIYGAVLDLCRYLIPALNPTVTPPGSMALYLRILYLAGGMILTSLAVSLFFKIYIYPEIYDLFVKGVSEKYHISTTKFKLIFDASSLALSLAMSFVLFGRLNGIGIGTVVMTCLNGFIIGFFGKVLDRFFVFEPAFKKFSSLFDLLSLERK